MAGITELSAASFVVAAAAGAASFLSPCVLPLLPGYLSFVSGVSVDRLQADTRRVVTSTAAFVMGFSLVFVSLGAGAGFVGDFLQTHRRPLQIVAGLLLIGLGVAVTGLIPFGALQRERRLLPFNPPRGLVGAGVTGVAFALGWTPCVGPILASILTLAATGGGPLSGALLLLAYSLGLGVPFLLAGLFFVRVVGALSWVKRHFSVVKIASGVILVAYGALLVTGRFSWLSSQLSGYRLFDF
ncbi:MAG: cytochrome c biogenesis protein CcdA [Thermoleophilia bacterium]|jgi:cytochrome c-type biogenesis protein|nr:cytochrome c biogenesis protein CcdA [Thermoleophilia bacterium]